MRNLIDIVSKLYEEKSVINKLSNGVEYLDRNHHLHREDGPAIIRSNGNKFWFLHGDSITIYNLGKFDGNDYKKIFIQLIIDYLLDDILVIEDIKEITYELFKRYKFPELKIILDYISYIEETDA